MPFLVLVAAAAVFLLTRRSGEPNWDTPDGQRRIDAVAEREVALSSGQESAVSITLRVAKSLYPRRVWPPPDSDAAGVEVWNKLLTVVTLILAEQEQR